MKYNQSRKRKHSIRKTFRKKRGGDGCSALDAIKGRKIHPNVYLHKTDDDKLIKSLNYKEEADYAEKAGELGIGPKVFELIHCSETKKIAMYTPLQQRIKARNYSRTLSTKNSPPEDLGEITYQTKSNTSYHLVMEKIEGHTLKKKEMEKTMDTIYDHYQTLFENGIPLLDVHPDNVMVSDNGRVYLIDYEAIDTRKQPKQLSKERMIRDFLEFYEENSQNTHKKSP